MTIDERLDKLAERHEALAQSLELLTLDVREVTAAVKALAAVALRHEERLNDIQG